MKILKLIFGLLLFSVFYSCDGGDSSPPCGSPEVNTTVDVIYIPNPVLLGSYFVDVEVLDQAQDCSQSFSLRNEPYAVIEHNIKIPTNHAFRIKATIFYIGPSGNRFFAEGEAAYSPGTTANLRVDIVGQFVLGYSGAAGDQVSHIGENIN